MLELKNISKRYGDVAVVHPLDLTIEEGEFFCILGPSGCGKTTLLRMIAGFDRPSAGRLLLDGVDITCVPPNQRDVNTVFQNYALFPHYKVFDNVAYGLKVRKTPVAETLERVMAALQLVGLSGFEHRLPAQLSGGQQQRVALARALINRPRLLLLDEPLITLLIAFPAAYLIASSPPRRQVWLLFLVFLPLWTNLLVRLYSFKIILGDNGLVNQLLQALAIVDEPLALIYTPLAVVVGFVYWNLPYMIPPIYAALERMNPSLLEASMDLGASRAATFWHIVIPASLPGVAAGVILCFVPTLGSFIVPDILGGPDSLMVGNVIAAQFGPGLNWPFGGALATLLTLLVTVGVTLYIRYAEPGRLEGRDDRG